MITEGECSSSRLRDNNNNNYENVAKTGYNRLHVEENVMLNVREGSSVAENDIWILGVLLI